MRILTLTQPWATLVAIGAKKIETRSWATKYRGPLAIHAAKGLGPLGGHGPSRLAHMCFVEPFRSVLVAAYGEHSAETLRNMLPRGAIVAVCELKDCHVISGLGPGGGPTIPDNTMFSMRPIVGNEVAFGLYTPGRYAWLLADIQALPEPIPCKGA